MSDKYFVYDPEGNGYDEYKTEEAAKADADDAIQGYLQDGWMEEVVNVVYGKITHRATQIDLNKRPPDNQLNEDNEDEEGTYWGHEFDTHCNYKMKPIG